MKPAIVLFLLLLASSRQANATPSFNDPTTLVTWLLEHSGHGFKPLNDGDNATVFSPGLRIAIQKSMLQSKQRDEPPCGADGDIILSTQENGQPEHLRLTKTVTAADRVSVGASFDVDGYHREKHFQTVMLDGKWKLENIIDEDGKSLRRQLACQ